METQPSAETHRERERERERAVRRATSATFNIHKQTETHAAAVKFYSAVLCCPVYS